MVKEELKLQAPWTTQYNKIVAMFGEDPDITIGMLNYDDHSFDMIVTNHDKYMSLCEFLDSPIKFGNVTFTANIYYEGRENEGLTLEATNASKFGKLFKGNPHLKKVKTVYTPMGAVVFVIFKNEVIQFYNDDTSDIYGNWCGLMEDIARDVFHNQNVNFCTALADED